LADPRSALFFEFARIASELRPRWLLVENVPGLLSSNEGTDFTVVIQTLDKLGYGLAWRILDSRYFGVPQRRRRVFIVGYLGAECPAEVLFEPEGGGRDTAAGGAAGEGVAGTLGGGAPGARGRAPLTHGSFDKSHAPGRRREDDENLVVHTLRALGFDASEDGTGRGTPLVTSGSVRRLTPTECERLQGFPEGWTCLCGCEPYSMAACRCPDGPRYAALGNAVTVNVARWIGGRLGR